MPRGAKIIGGRSFAVDGRELRALNEAASEYPQATQRLLVLDRDALARVKSSKVQVQPTYEWLLETPSEDSTNTG